MHDPAITEDVRAWLQLLSDALKDLVGAKPGYDAAKARALARLIHGYDLDWAPPASRDELHDR